MEAKAAYDSGVLVKAKRSGVVEYVVLKRLLLNRIILRMKMLWMNTLCRSIREQIRIHVLTNVH